MKSMKFSGLTIVAPAPAEQPRDVGAGEAAARDQRAAERALPLCDDVHAAILAGTVLELTTLMACH